MLKWKAYDNDIYNDDITKHFESLQGEMYKKYFFSLNYEVYWKSASLTEISLQFLMCNK